MPATPTGAQRLEALETHVLAARCLAGIGQLSELILGPRARHEELLLATLLARARPEALAAQERAQSESAERARALERELETLRSAQAQVEQRAEELGSEREALELGRSALE